jgi:hypothetical protein
MAIFTACTTGTLALYEQPDGSTLALPVEAWGAADDLLGVPYVAGTDRLERADSRPGFQRLEVAALVLPPAVETRKPVKVGPADRPQPGRRPVVRGPRDPREGRL